MSKGHPCHDDPATADALGSHTLIAIARDIAKTLQAPNNLCLFLNRSSQDLKVSYGVEKKATTETPKSMCSLDCWGVHTKVGVAEAGPVPFVTAKAQVRVATVAPSNLTKSCPLLARA